MGIKLYAGINYRIMFDLFLVIQDIDYYIVIWELLGKMEEMFWVNLEAEGLDINRKPQSQRSQRPRCQDTMQSLPQFPPFPWYSLGKWPHTDPHLRTIQYTVWHIVWPTVSSHRPGSWVTAVTIAYGRVRRQSSRGVRVCALWPSRPSLHEHRSL